MIVLMGDNGLKSQTTTEPDERGGRGELLTDGQQERGDLCLLERAVRERWPIPASARNVMAKIAAIAEDETKPTGHRLKAARILLEADRLNQADEHKRTADHVLHCGASHITVLTDANFYGNADRLAGKTVDASIAAPAIRRSE
jgi:hypothetical protein